MALSGDGSGDGTPHPELRASGVRAATSSPRRRSNELYAFETPTARRTSLLGGTPMTVGPRGDESRIGARRRDGDALAPDPAHARVKRGSSEPQPNVRSEVDGDRDASHRGVRGLDRDPHVAVRTSRVYSSDARCAASIRGSPYVRATTTPVMSTSVPTRDRDDAERAATACARAGNADLAAPKNGP